MSNVLGSPEAGNAEEAPASPPVRLSKKKTVADFEKMLKTARLKLAQAKREYHDLSVRDRGIRERYTGATVLRMIDEGKLDASTIALIGDEVRASFCSPKQVAAFRGSIFLE